ncbi:MAG: flagellar brake protein [Cellvibrionaceae bacterium]|nr:flagellar brake protein [Cellvibrionaceae bacterium]
MQHLSPAPQGAYQRTEAITDKPLAEQLNRYGILIQLQDDRQLLALLFPNGVDSFQTMILGIDLYQQQLTLDALTPSIKNPEDMIGSALYLRHYQSNQVLLLQTTLIACNQQDHSLQVSLPQNIHYQPRRAQQRVTLGVEASAKATLYPLYGAPWYATVNNISCGGMRIAVSGDLRAALHKHLVIKRCELHLTAQNRLCCRGRVKAFSYHSRPFRHTLISIAFEALTEDTLAELQDFIDDCRLVA